MTEEEMRAFEKRAPTDLNLLKDEGYPLFSWEKEFFLAAARADIPRMARALDKGLDPKTVDATFGRPAAYRYALALGGWGIENDALRVRFSPTDIEQVWAWFKARGIPTEEAWDLLYGNNAPHAHPVEAKCAEVNLWALWNSLSQQERSSTLAQIDQIFSLEHPSSSEAVTTLKGLPCFTSSLMKETLALKGITHSYNGKALPVARLQDRVLALSSLLRARQGLSLEGSIWDSKECTLLGLWAYAPAPVLQDLAHLPFYRPLLTACLTPLITTLHKNRSVRPHDVPVMKAAALVAQRLARGTRTLLQNGFEFSPEDIKRLLTVDEVRPLLEQSLFREALVPQETVTCPESTARSRTRL